MASTKPTAVKTSKLKANQADEHVFEYTYEEARKHLVKLLKKQKKKQTYKAFCTENKIPYTQFIMFKNDNLYGPSAINFLPIVLKALGFDVKKQNTITFKTTKQLTAPAK